jgi:plastocyanin
MARSGGPALHWAQTKQEEKMNLIRVPGRYWQTVAAAVVLSAMFGFGDQVHAYDGSPVSNGGSISGVVKFKGSPPPRQKLDITKDKEVCAVAPKLSQDLVVGPDGGIQYAVVSIQGIEKGKPFGTAKSELDQKGCEYVPHVTLVPAGKPLQVVNSDGILHNIHSYSKENPPMNRAQPKFKKTIEETFEKPEFVKIACDVHGWMNGWIVVEGNPYYAVTDDKGQFKLTDVPPGDYELRVWQEKLGETTQKVSVQPGADTAVTFELSSN